MTNEAFNVPVPVDGDVTYTVVRLTEEQQVKDNPAVSGIKIDGVTIRVDDVKWEDVNNEYGPLLVIDYKIVDGIPDDLREFEAKLSKVMMHITDSYMTTTE